jgi:hypothetical protein
MNTPRAPAASSRFPPGAGNGTCAPLPRNDAFYVVQPFESQSRPTIDGPHIHDRREDQTMKAIRLSSIALLLSFAFAACALTANAQKAPIKIFMSPRSNVPLADIVKNLNDKCSNATVVSDSTKSDYMLEAVGWPNGYKFVLFKKGGEVVYATTTAWLSNSVKDVCKYVNAHPAQ